MFDFGLIESWISSANKKLEPQGLKLVESHIAIPTGNIPPGSAYFVYASLVRHLC